MARKKVSAAPGAIDLPALIKQLERSLDASRMQKATSMLKADRFQLFAEVDADHLIGVVKSQSEHDLFYSCRLGADGSFACCTQNLNVCGGLRGALCKHLLVLVIGLVQAGQLEAATSTRAIGAVGGCNRSRPRASASPARMARPSPWPMSQARLRKKARRRPENAASCAR